MNSQASPSQDDQEQPRFVVVTGMSGAGKSIALQALADVGFETVDNLPVALISAIVAAHEDHSIAIGVDARTRDFDAGALLSVVEALRQQSKMKVGFVFVDADTDVLVQRYTETRRPHPMAKERPIADGIEIERRLLEPMREEVDFLVDTTRLAPADLKRIVQGQFGGSGQRCMQIFLMSFGFRNGLPRDADQVLDVRFLKNPHYEPTLRALTGQDEAVGAYIEQDPATHLFIERATALLEPLLPLYEREGKSYFTIAIGCTGGQHRSVYIVERLKLWFTKKGVSVDVRHRDMPRHHVQFISGPR
ncbi:MAG: RNase adapter RapZ [Alphaproteobacteria bacterium]|nr:RNase adapter RapZ [Alphaproteobacteria bacterium]PHX98769.1 MAG: RNase adapter RapZ [Rhodospirillaceae bacterium]